MKTSPYLNIKRIEIIVTNRCNGQCLHCSAAEDSGRLRHSQKTADHKRLFYK